MNIINPYFSQLYRKNFAQLDVNKYIGEVESASKLQFSRSTFFRKPHFYLTIAYVAYLLWPG